jgi:hypothetical protein
MPHPRRQTIPLSPVVAASATTATSKTTDAQ